MSQATRETSLWKDQEKLITFNRIVTALEKTTREVLVFFRAQINTCPPNYVKLIQGARLVMNVIRSMENNIVMTYPKLRHVTARKQLADCMQLLESQQRLRQEATQQLMQVILLKQLNEGNISSYYTRLNEAESLTEVLNRMMQACAVTLKVEVKIAT